MSKFNTLALRTLGDDYRENWLWYTRKYKTTISKNDLKASDLIHLRKKNYGMKFLFYIALRKNLAKPNYTLTDLI